MTHLHRYTALSLFTGIVLTFVGSASHVEAQLSGQGGMFQSMKPEVTLKLVQGPLHTAAPIASMPDVSAGPSLVAGMAFILLGFFLSLLIVRRERKVHITDGNKKKAERVINGTNIKDGTQWYWLRVKL